MNCALRYGKFLLLFLLLTSLAGAAEVPELDRDGFASLLQANRGKVVLVNFWATWCKPCRYEIPGLSRIRDTYPTDTVTVVGVSVDADPERLRHFIHDEPIPYPVYRSDLNLKREQGAFMIPLTLVYSPAGELVERHVGYVSPQVAEGDIRRHLPAVAARHSDAPDPLDQSLALRETSPGVASPR